MSDEKAQELNSRDHLCSNCIWRVGHYPGACEAFPTGIPDNIVDGTFEHTTRHPLQDNDYLYRENRFISHDLLAVRHISDRVAVMYLGQIVETGTAQEIFSAPIHPYARALISSVLFPDPDQVRPRFLLKGEIPSPINLPQGCYLFSRCPLAQTGWCEQSVPPLEALTDTRSIACLPVVTEYRRGVSLEEFGLLQHGIAIDHEDSLATGKALQGQNPG